MVPEWAPLFLQQHPIVYEVIAALVVFGVVAGPFVYFLTVVLPRRVMGKKH